MQQINKQDKALMLAERFYRLHHHSGERTFRKVMESLFALSLKVRPDVWRQFRNALSFEAEYRGQLLLAQDIKKLFNPTTMKKDELKITSAHSHLEVLNGMHPKKQNRCKKVTEQDHKKITEYLKINSDHAVLGAVLLAYHTGMRPVEMLNVELIPEKSAIFIHGAKKNIQGNRGLSRELTFAISEYKIIEQAYFAIQLEKKRVNRSGVLCDPNRIIERIQKRLADSTEKIFPRRQHRITLYSYRHQMGSNLKASGMDHISVAAIMGHQSVDSVDKYGKSRSATIKPSISVSEKSKAGVRKKIKRLINEIFSNLKQPKTPIL